MKRNRVSALSISDALQTQGRITSAVVVGLASSLLAGCSLFGGGAPCVQYEYQNYQVQVCDNRTETGWCSASHWEERSRSVCVQRAEPTVGLTGTAKRNAA